MSFNVKSWERLSDDQLVPLCKPVVLAEDKEKSTDANERISREIGFYGNLLTNLMLCWEYFVAGYQCYCLSKEAWHSERDYLLSLEKFQFSFKDLKNPEHKIQIFELHTNCILRFMHPGYDYVCDRTGFALIYYMDEILQLYYYDFRRKFTTYINIPFCLNKYCYIKLYSRTLWILNRKFRYDVYSKSPNTKSYLAYFLALIIKDSNIWSSVQSKIKTGYLMVDHVKSNSNLVCINDLSLGLLHIDLKSLAPNSTNYVPTDKVPDPVEFAVLKTRLTEGSCRTAIVDLSENSKVLCIYFLEGILNFLYFESEQVILVKRLELGQQLFTSSRTEVANCYFISELGIMVVQTIKSLLFIINVKECKVTQIFDLEIPHDDWLFLLNYSKNFQKLTVTCYVPQKSYSLPHVMISKRKIVLAFDLRDALLPLKKLVIGLIKKHCKINDIEKLNLPLSLKKEILDEMIY